MWTIEPQPHQVPEPTTAALLGLGLVGMAIQFFGALAEGRIVEPESLAQMLDAGWRNPETPGSHYGLGVFVADGGRQFGHGGFSRERIHEALDLCVRAVRDEDGGAADRAVAMNETIERRGLSRLTSDTSFL